MQAAQEMGSGLSTGSGHKSNINCHIMLAALQRHVGWGSYVNMCVTQRTHKPCPSSFHSFPEPAAFALCWPQEEGVWVVDDTCSTASRVSFNQVLRVVDAELGQRQDRDHNPHGEHCHDIWQASATHMGPRTWGVRAGENAKVSVSR